jgi:hypothetical protein
VSGPRRAVRRSADRGPRLPRGWGVSFSAVQICIENAERLLVDATKTSPPTSAALAELSIEESSKAWMLFFRFMAQGRSVRNLPRVPTTGRKAMEGVIASNLRDFQNLDARILEAFRGHRVKLRFLGVLLQLLEISLPLLSRTDELARIGQDIQGPAINVREVDPAKEIESISQLISSFRLDGLTDLDSVKKRGFYVNITDKGDLISPSIYSLPTRLLIELAAFLIVALKANLLIVSHQLSPRAGPTAATAPPPPAVLGTKSSRDDLAPTVRDRASKYD